MEDRRRSGERGSSTSVSVRGRSARRELLDLPAMDPGNVVHVLYVFSLFLFCFLRGKRNLRPGAPPADVCVFGYMGFILSRMDQIILFGSNTMKWGPGEGARRRHRIGSMRS
jgi:hypothetical protein